MKRSTRAWLARFAAPAAFLLAATIAILLIRSALGGGSKTTTSITVVTSTAPTSTERTTTARPKHRFYAIQSGDTLASVAGKFNTTVEKLLALNPTIDPRSLRIGQKLRIE